MAVRSRRICYVTGTRADFGLMRTTLERIASDPALELELLVTGMHLDERHGLTVAEIEDAELAVAARVPIPLIGDDDASMARNIATMLDGFAARLAAHRPDAVLLLGDRGEMLAGAIAALHLNIPIFHVHGGERSGTVDEPVRHAISKLSHVHCVATEASRERLVRMGENEAHIHIVGAPGLDGIVDGASAKRADLAIRHGLDPDVKLALVLFHAVHQTADRAGEQASTVLDAVRASGCQVIVLMPNSDSGGRAIRAVLEARRGPGVVLVEHLPRGEFLSALKEFDLLVGNSSAGIIEAASFGIPVVNIGDRQNLRERNANVRDVPCELSAVASVIADALAYGRYPCTNIYGDGRAAGRIVALLRDTPLDAGLLAKVNSY